MPARKAAAKISGRKTTRPRAGNVYMRKTTAKGAYRKNAKRNMGRRRAPFVETKNQTDEVVALKTGNATGTPVDTIRRTTEPLKINYGTWAAAADGGPTPVELNIFPIQSFLNMNKGLDTSDMIGNTVYSKYLKCKVEFQLPYGNNQIRHPCDMFLIHGFVTAPTNNTFHTTPTMTAFTRSNLNDHIKEQLEQYFNQRSDKLQYIPKRTSNIKFLGYRKLKVKKSSNLGVDPNTMAVSASGVTSILNAGAHPVINMTCSWPMKRKVVYNLGTAGATATALDFNYPNHSWLPFMALYNPTAVEFLQNTIYPGDSAGGAPKSPDMYIRYNSVHYFTDS
jgi:hypothetical protein